MEKGQYLNTQKHIPFSSIFNMDKKEEPQKRY
jgi:hypothetical protein